MTPLESEANPNIWVGPLRWGRPAHSNPRAAIRMFLDENANFEMDMSFTGSGGPSLFPDGFLRRVT